MSDKNKNIRSILTDFFRYHRNELSGEERNSFERELQKDPLAEEAADGFASITPEEALKDITDLQKRLKTRFVRRQKFLVYRIAASIAVLMVISTLFIFIEKNKTEKQLADNSIQSKTPEITKSQPVAEPVAKDRASEKQKVFAAKKTDKSATRKIIVEKGKSVGRDEKLQIAEERKNDSVSEFKEEPFQIYVAEEQKAVPVNAMAKERSLRESKEFDVKADTQVQVRLDPSVTALSEVVVVGYGVKKTDSDNEEANTGHTPPQPTEGKSKFDKYIQDNLHRPDSATTGQRVVVVVSFLVHVDGHIDSIRIVRSPGKSFSDEAIRIIKSGPSWKPAEDNGKPVEDEVRMKIVFK